MKRLKTVVLTLLTAISAIAGTTHLDLIPTVEHITTNGNTVTLSCRPTIAVGNNILKDAGLYLSEVIGGELTDNLTDATITLTTVDNIADKDAYHLTINDRGKVIIEVADYNGAINAISSLQQLAEFNTCGLHLPVVDINDSPRYKWRGMHLDSVRHFWTVDEVRHFIDLMAMYKFNYLHWHLIDDEGWRVEIDQYPELTAKGAYRKFDQHDIDSEKMAIEQHDASLLIPRDRMTTDQNGDSIYGGFYTKAQLRDIIDYARIRGIEIVPEFDLPGHSTMLTTIHNEISCDGIPGNSVCPGKDATIELCKNIYREIFELFPSKYVHVGGDEVNKTKWEKCSDCARRIADNGLNNTAQLQAWFIRQMEQFFNENGKTLIGWDEVCHDDLGPQSIIMWWRADYPATVADATSQGKQVICNPTRWFYFDSKQTDKSVAMILDFNPDDWAPTSEQRNLILGVQGNTWSEYIPTMDRLEYMIFPRMTALAEIAWAKPDNKLSYSDFWKKAQSHLNRLEDMDVNFMIPQVNGVAENIIFSDSITLNPWSNLSNAVIRYTLDGSIPDSTSTIAGKEVTIDHDCTLTIAPFHRNGRRSGYTVSTLNKGSFAEPCEIIPDKEGLLLDWHENRANSCSTVTAGRLLKQLTVDSISLPEDVKENLSIRFHGYIYAPVDGYYLFSTTSDDGSNLAINDVTTVDNDGFHVPLRKETLMPLKKGWHKIEVRYFDYHDNGSTFQADIECVTDPTQKIIYRHI